jgi:glycosyltransferase involved in cell wall biosynthesis
MRIAILGSVALPVPPPFQGGTEWIAYYQAKGLAKLGHQVLLIGGQGTAANFQESNIQVIEVGEGGLVNGGQSEVKFDPNTMEASRKLRLEMVRLSTVSELLIDNKDTFDIVLNNMRGEAIFLPLVKYLDKKFVNVMHLNLFPELAELFKKFSTPIITISNAQRKDFPDLNYLSTVYNCVDTQKYAFNPTPSNYLLMVGTIGRHKNQKSAISVARKLKMPLILAGKIRDQDYFDELKPDIDGQQIKWVGELGFEEKLKLYQDAKAFIFPINWNEPFGLVLIEALACGTPVVAFNHGAVSEVIENGKTGFVVENEDEMTQSILRIDSLLRQECRKSVEEKFTVEKMVNAYQEALSKLA